MAVAPCAVAVEASTSPLRAVVAEQPLEVVTTFSMLADFTRQVGAERADRILSKPAAAEHTAPQKAA